MYVDTTKHEIYENFDNFYRFGNTETHSLFAGILSNKTNKTVSIIPYKCSCCNNNNNITLKETTTMFKVTTTQTKMRHRHTDPHISTKAVDSGLYRCYKGFDEHVLNITHVKCNDCYGYEYNLQTFTLGKWLCQRVNKSNLCNPKTNICNVF